ncbi:DUF4349 domain-containing protein [Sphaerisporangium sp. TRM90804]|uniref:DUF4349 domain-containing protein n=1 Tax=Sphaerisporangium sp. TRM90804 TaxID=3031113 RepID=UPI00244D4757|nr:DUF4349 domain-containing protein [Sphaerisporangium sp. TRM90804]MDH2424252.1 DUF4349 domain-containing protein [Sphaerisporangium sp. TRM90804]
MVLGAVVLLSGCAGGASDTAAGAPAANLAEDAAGPQSRPKRAPAAGAASDAARAEGATGEAGAPKEGDVAGVEVAPADRAIVYTGEMTVRARDVTAAADRAKQIVAAAGGRLGSEESMSFGREAGATLVFKVPPERYQALLTQLGKDLGRRESLRQSTEDVTEQVADVDSRVRSARAALEQLRSLLSRAKTIGEVLSVEREISGRESELESLLARQKTLAAQTAEATLTLRLVGPAAVVARTDPEPPPGFLSGLEGGWKALKTTARVVLLVTGALLPWLVPIALLWLGYLAVRRRLRPAPPLGGSPAVDPDPDPPAAPGPPVAVAARPEGGRTAGED